MVFCSETNNPTHTRQSAAEYAENAAEFPTCAGAQLNRLRAYYFFQLKAANFRTRLSETRRFLFLAAIICPAGSQRYRDFFCGIYFVGVSVRMNDSLISFIQVIDFSHSCACVRFCFHSSRKNR